MENSEPVDRSDLDPTIRAGRAGSDWVNETGDSVRDLVICAVPNLTSLSGWNHCLDLDFLFSGRLGVGVSAYGPGPPAAVFEGD